VDALVVVLDDLVLPPRVAHGGFLAFAMTPAAQSGHVGGKSDRVRIMFPQDVMGAVALLAVGSVGIVSGQQLTVFAALVLLADFLVAAAAVHRMGDGFAGADARGVDFGVTLAARDLGMARARHFHHSHKQRAAVGRLQVLVVVAAHAIGVRHTLAVEHVADLMGLVDSPRKQGGRALPSPKARL